MATFEHDNRSRAEFELNKIIEREAEQKRIAAGDFQHLHKTGAEKFGVLWLSCNIAVSSLRDLPYLSSTDKRIDALLSQCAWKMAEQIAARDARIKLLEDTLRSAVVKIGGVKSSVVRADHYYPLSEVIDAIYGVFDLDEDETETDDE